MPYIATSSGVYIGEHTCGVEHYGNQDLVRPCCVRDAIDHVQSANSVALTSSHPSAVLALAALNSLTQAECKLVPNLEV